MSDKKTKQDGDSLVKKLLSSNLTWSVVALIVLIVICTISDHNLAVCIFLIFRSAYYCTIAQILINTG